MNRISPTLKAILACAAIITSAIVTPLAIAESANDTANRHNQLDPISETIATGKTWHKNYGKVKGTWTIETTSDGTHVLELAEDFKANRGPDVKIALSTADASTVTGRNALDNATKLAELSSFKGQMRFAIPETVDISQIRSVVLHCEQYSKLWAVGPVPSDQDEDHDE